MPRKAKELTALAVGRLRDNGRHAVGGVDGLHLRVVGGSRAWVLRITNQSRRCDVGLGPYPEVSLAEAREAAFVIRRQIRNGGDPVSDKRKSRQAAKSALQPVKTFKECAVSYIESQEAGWKNAKHGKQWSATLEAYAYPAFGDLPVSTIDTALVLEALRPIWATKTETASRLRGRIESILDWARVNELREGENPARWRGHLDKTLPARSKVSKVEHHAALPYVDLPTFMTELEVRTGYAGRALCFSILCASRSGEVRLATWDELDLEQGTWTIPALRMKAGREHRVPLSPQALALLHVVPRLEKSRYVFPAPGGGPLSDMALTAVLRRMGQGSVTQHGFRSTFRDWAGETTQHPREVIEHALAHQLKDKAEAAHQRGDLLRRRRLLMEDWGTYCTRHEENSAGD